MGTKQQSRLKYSQSLMSISFSSESDTDLRKLELSEIEFTIKLLVRLIFTAAGLDPQSLEPEYRASS